MSENSTASAGKADEAQERSRDRSPSFPFISLKDAVERAKTFEAVHRRFAARLPIAAELWKISPKSSTMLQTVAALKAYGLMKDSGSGADRKVELTDLAQRILKDARPGNREEAIKQAALKPRLIAEHWTKCGLERPPDATCLSDLHLDQKFTEDAAARFLRVYDDTISFAGLSGTDKPPPVEDESPAKDEPQKADNVVRHHSSGTGGGGGASSPRASSAGIGSAGSSGGASRVQNERMVFSQEIEAHQSLKVLVSGPVDDAVLDALDDFVSFQRKRLERAQKIQGATPAGEVTPAETDPLLE